jgi:hypothetical protein
MKVKLLNKYSVAALLMMVAAAGLIAIALISSLSEFVTASFVISGLVCAMTGIFLITFSAGEPVDPRFVGILPVQGCMNFFKIAMQLGITGNAYFLPPRLTGETRVMQYNPSSTYSGGMIPGKDPLLDTSERGLVTIPTGDPLIQALKKRHGLHVPHNKEQVIQVLRETGGEIFELAPRVSVRWSGNTITITLKKYRFIEGCRVIAREAPDSCIRSPCPVCSLFGALIAEGMDKAVTLEQCASSPLQEDLNITWSIVADS